MMPKLKIVSLSDVIPLMANREDKVEYLRKTIEDSGSVRNPLSLARMEDHKYILLEDSAILDAATSSRNKDHAGSVLIPAF